MTRINQSWRDQRKAVVADDGEVQMQFISVWEASVYCSLANNCKRETAKKEIRKAIKNGVSRYGYKWRFKEDSLNGLT